MSLLIDLPKPVEERIEAAALKAGIPTARYAADVLIREVGIPAQNLAAVTLLRRWHEDATEDKDELARREADTAELYRNLNAARQEAGAELLFPETSEGGQRK